MTTMRGVILLLAATLSPNCRRDSIEWVEVTVHNDGAVSAEVRSEAEYWTRHFWEDHVDRTVSPGGSVQFHHRFDDLTRLEVRIYRSSDSLKIFDADWNRDELEDLNETLTIMIDP